RSVDMMKLLIDRINAIPEVNVVGGLAGLNIISFSTKSNAGTLFVTLKPWAERKGKGQHAQDVMNRVRASVADIKEARVLVIAPPACPGLGATSGFTFQLLHTTSTDDVQQLEQVGQDFLARLLQRPESGSAYTFFNSRTPSYKVDVDKEQAKKLGVSVSEVYTTLSTFLGSSYVNDFDLYGRNLRVMSQADSSFRTSLDGV